MKLQSLTIGLLCSGLGLIAVSCNKDDAASPTTPQAGATAANFTVGEGDLQLETGVLADGRIKCTYEAFTQAIFADAATTGVAPSPCAPTAFNTALAPYVTELNRATLAERQNYSLLSQLSQLYTYVDPATPYFGADGSLTDFAAKTKRSLESFWNMPNEVTLHGQHVNSLQNREAIAAVYRNFSTASEQAAYANADFIIANYVLPSTVFKTSPLLALDGFATTGLTTRTGKVVGDLIVIGDGLVQVMNEAGVNKQVTFAGILGHEWAHQIQFNNYEAWYGPRVNTAEQTRMTELEADLLSSYYLTHKRGATYNWKSSAEFFKLFFNIGDCSFISEGHHGTPNQRMAASRLGWIIAQETMPMGHILTAQETHDLFIASLQSIIDNKIDSSAAMANLKTPQLKAVFGKIVEREREVKSILTGQLNSTAIENL